MMPNRSEARRWADIELGFYNTEHSGELVSTIEALNVIFPDGVEQRKNRSGFAEYVLTKTQKIAGVGCARCGIVLGPPRIETEEGKRTALKYRCSHCREYIGERVLSFRD